MSEKFAIVWLCFRTFARALFQNTASLCYRVLARTIFQSIASLWPIIHRNFWGLCDGFCDEVYDGFRGFGGRWVQKSHPFFSIWSGL